MRIRIALALSAVVAAAGCAPSQPGGIYTWNDGTFQVSNCNAGIGSGSQIDIYVINTSSTTAQVTVTFKDGATTLTNQDGTAPQVTLAAGSGTDLEVTPTDGTLDCTPFQPSDLTVRGVGHGDS